MIRETINDLLISIAQVKMDELSNKEFIDGGSNGPYNCVDTPVRNSAHWCVTFSYLYNITKEKKYYEAIIKLSNYILKIEGESASGSIKCMDGKNFTDTNGLIGQAWAIEGLLFAYKTTKKEKYLNCAKKIFDSQEFDFNEGEWYQIDTNGINRGFDVAFNHQLWFAAIGLELNNYVKNEKISFKIEKYIEKLDDNFKIYGNGMIKHLGRRKKKLPIVNKIKKSIKRLYPLSITKKNPDTLSIISFESAYQLFNLYGFAIIKQYKPDLPFFYSKKFLKALNYGMNIKKLNKIFNTHPNYNEKTCKYAYPYNSPAFEYGYIAEVFNYEYSNDLIIELLNIQKELCYCDKSKCYDKNTFDANTLTARIYELVRFLEVMDDE